MSDEITFEEICEIITEKAMIQYEIIRQMGVANMYDDVGVLDFADDMFYKACL